MSPFQHYRIEKLNDQGEFALVLYLDDFDTEFAQELGTKPEKRRSMLESAREIARTQYPKLKVKVVKVVVGGLVVTSIPFAANLDSALAQTSEPNPHTQQQTANSSTFYQVQSGDTLWNLAKKFGTTVEDIQRANKLATDVLALNQQLIIPKAFHTVKTGDYLSVLARDYGTSITAIKEANQLRSDAVQLGQTLIIPATLGSQETVKTEEPQKIDGSYTVAPGDSLSVIAKRFGITTEALRSANYLTSDIIRVGQVLKVPGEITAPQPSNEAPPAKVSSYTVAAGDSLSVIAKRFGVSVDALRTANQLSSDMIQIGQTLTIPSGESTTSATTHTVASGDNLWSIANRYGTTIDAIRAVNGLTTDILQPGQKLAIPTVSPAPLPPPSSQPVKEEERKTFTYRVIAGDSLSVIAKKFGVTTAAIQSANQLKTDTLQVGQALTIPDGLNAPANAGHNTITYKTHTVVSGDNIWDLSVRYGIPQGELLRANNLTTSSTLKLGQKLTIPVHHIAAKEVVSAKHGELMDWWTEAQYIFTIGKTAKVTDVATGKSFYIKRTIGANHADSETVSVNDTNIAKSIWGGFSWKTRAVIVEVDGRKMAGSMSFMPHEREYIANNGINGHFDVYFSNSTRHSDGKPDPLHQAQVEKAAGLR